MNDDFGDSLSIREVALLLGVSEAFVADPMDERILLRRQDGRISRYAVEMLAAEFAGLPARDAEQKPSRTGPR